MQSYLWSLTILHVQAASMQVYLAGPLDIFSTQGHAPARHGCSLSLKATESLFPSFLDPLEIDASALIAPAHGINAFRTDAEKRSFLLLRLDKRHLHCLSDSLAIA